MAGRMPEQDSGGAMAGQEMARCGRMPRAKAWGRCGESCPVRAGQAMYQAFAPLIE